MGGNTLALTHLLSASNTQIAPVASLLLQSTALPGDVGGAQTPGVQVHTERRERRERKQRDGGCALRAATSPSLVTSSF